MVGIWERGVGINLSDSPQSIIQKGEIPYPRDVLEILCEQFPPPQGDGNVVKDDPPSGLIHHLPRRYQTCLLHV